VYMIPRVGDSGGIETTGYAGTYGIIYAGQYSGCGIPTDRLPFQMYSSDVSGMIQLDRVSTSSNKWLARVVMANETTESNDYMYLGAGRKETSAALDRAELSTASSTFDGGTWRVLYR